MSVKNAMTIEFLRSLWRRHGSHAISYMGEIARKKASPISTALKP